MKITFTRTAAEACQTTVIRKDGVTLAIPTHDRPKIMPHDLAHFIIEKELQLAKGFWGKVAAGAIFHGMIILTGRQKPQAKQKSTVALKDENQSGTYAEVLVSTILHIALDNLEHDWYSCEKELSEMWVPPNIQPLSWTHERLIKLCVELREAKNNWQKLKVGETLHVSWTLKA